MDCQPCEWGAENGWWGSTLPTTTAAHCSTCHASWPGTQKWGHCTMCHRTFRGLQTFNHHQESGICTIHDLDEWRFHNTVYQLQQHQCGTEFFAAVGRVDAEGTVTLFSEKTLV